MKTIQLILFLCVIFLLNSISYAVTSAVREPYITLEKQLQKNFYPNGTTSVNTTVDYHFGTYLPGSNQTKTCFRTVWSFTLPTDLPVGAYASSTRIKFKVNTDDFFKIGVISGYTNGTAEAVWNQTENADIIGTLDGVNGSEVTVSNDDLLDYVRAAHENSQTKIYLMLKSGREDVNTNLAVIQNVFSTIINYLVQPQYTFENNFDAGSLVVNSENKSNGFSKRFDEQSTITVSAIEPQNASSYTYIWNDTEAPTYHSDWQLVRQNGTSYTLSNNQSITHQAVGSEHKSTIIANLRKKFTYSFTNQLSGTTQTGQFVINGTTYPAPKTNFVGVEGNTIAVSASLNYDFDSYFQYRFYQWSDGVTTPARTISPTQSQTLTAIYKKVPKFGQSISNLQITTTGGNQNKVKITWTDHPDPGVSSYQIWRLFKRVNGELQSPLTPVYYATVNRGAQQFIDDNLTYTATDNDNYEVAYIVRPYYNVDQTLSDNVNFTSFVNVYQTDQQSGPIGKTAANSLSAVTEYSLMNYPNPFNPTTQIEYTLKEDGFVTLKIYDITGREVAALVNERLSKGRYTAEFNALNLSSGVYLCTIKVNDYFATKKMILTK